MSILELIRRVIARVPRGRVTTYGQVARAAGFPRAARLTVWALQGGGSLPWHRVVAVGGRIALSGAEGQEQRLRLQLEGVTFRGGRVRMELHGWDPERRREPRRRRNPVRARPPGNSVPPRRAAGTAGARAKSVQPALPGEYAAASWGV